MRNKILIVLISIYCLISYKGKAQDSIRVGNWISLNAHYGFILPVYTEGMNVLIKAHVPGIEGDYLFKPSGSEQWQSDYRCAETGVSFFYAWLGNPAQLGNEMGIYPYINFHLKRTYREGLSLRTGLGLAYLPVIFNQQTNHKDILIGTHINTMINLRLTYHYYLSDKMRIETGFGLTHCSNGSFKTPNLGINLITVNTGVSYCIKESKIPAPVIQPDTNRKKTIHEFYITGGVSETEPPGGQQYGAISCSYTIYHVINRKSKLGGGVDIFYNAANITQSAGDSVHTITKLQNIQVGLKGAYELTIGHIGIPFELGGYLFTESTGHGYEYNRVGIRYYTNSHFIINCSLLAHFASADFVEWGIGYKL